MTEKRAEIIPLEPEVVSELGPVGQWCIVELMGHQRMAGLVVETKLAGVGVLRVDVPSEPPATCFVRPENLYRLTPTTEAMARSVAKTSTAKPVSQWELPPPKQPEPTVAELQEQLKAARAREKLQLNPGKSRKRADDIPF